MQPHSSSALRYASAAQAVHSRVYGGCTAEAAASEASGPRVSGCIRESAKLRPSPVRNVASGALGRWVGVGVVPCGDVVGMGGQLWYKGLV